MKRDFDLSSSHWFHDGQSAVSFILPYHPMAYARTHPSDSLEKPHASPSNSVIASVTVLAFLSFGWLSCLTSSRPYLFQAATLCVFMRQIPCS